MSKKHKKSQHTHKLSFTNTHFEILITKYNSKINFKIF